MGLLNKLKNVLFEEEEIEEVKEIEKTKEINIPKVSKDIITEKYDVEKETDKDLFEAQKTFDFPAFDEDEFEDFIPKKKEVVEKKVEVQERRTRPTAIRPREYTSTRIVKPEVQTSKKLFKPSPVISPVYGILDKNYKKEDVITRDEALEKNNNVILDVDSVRKKAFGALQDDINKNIEPEKEVIIEDILISEEVTPIIYEPEIESMKELNDFENLLEKTIDVEIDVTKEMEIPSRVKDSYEEEDLEKTIASQFDIDVDVEKLDETESEDEDSDLFDLIDSMYENREEED